MEFNPNDLARIFTFIPNMLRQVLSLLDNLNFTFLFNDQLVTVSFLWVVIAFGIIF